jgi:hypothetical protein
MLGDHEESVFDRLWEMIIGKFAFLFPLRIIRRPESLTILDYRPTLTMFLTAAGFAILAISAVFIFFGYDASWLWAIGAPGIVCLFLVFRGTIREVYHFDTTTDSYTFVRQFIHRKEVIEGSMGQFTGASVKTVNNDESTSYFVVLRQEGMFLTGVDEQILREEVPIFNSFDREAEIASAISGFLSTRSAAAIGTKS